MTVIRIADVRRKRDVEAGRGRAIMFNHASLITVVEKNGEFLIKGEAYINRAWKEVEWVFRADRFLIHAKAAVEIARVAANAEFHSKNPELAPKPYVAPKWRRCGLSPEGYAYSPRKRGGCNKRRGHEGAHKSTTQEWVFETCPHSRSRATKTGSVCELCGEARTT